MEAPADAMNIADGWEIVLLILLNLALILAPSEKWTAPTSAAMASGGGTPP